MLKYIKRLEYKADKIEFIGKDSKTVAEFTSKFSDTLKLKGKYELQADLNADGHSITNVGEIVSKGDVYIQNGGILKVGYNSNLGTNEVEVLRIEKSSGEWSSPLTHTTRTEEGYEDSSGIWRFRVHSWDYGAGLQIYNEGDDKVYWFADVRTTTVKQRMNLVPYDDNTYNLGSESLRWANIYCKRFGSGSLKDIDDAVECNSSIKFSGHCYSLFENPTHTMPWGDVIRYGGFIIRHHDTEVNGNRGAEISSWDARSLVFFSFNENDGWSFVKVDRTNKTMEEVLFIGVDGHPVRQVKGGVELGFDGNNCYVNAYPQDDNDRILYLSARRHVGDGKGASDFVLLKPGGHFVPNEDNAQNLGESSKRWANVYAVNVVTGDVKFDNKWKITEYEEDGKLIDGLRVLNAKGEEVLRITNEGVWFKGKKIA